MISVILQIILNFFVSCLPLRLKGAAYKSYVRLAILYGSEAILYGSVAGGEF